MSNDRNLYEITINDKKNIEAMLRYTHIHRVAANDLCKLMRRKVAVFRDISELTTCESDDTIFVTGKLDDLYRAQCKNSLDKKEIVEGWFNKEDVEVVQSEMGEQLRDTSLDFTGVNKVYVL